ncbi:PREDICTED: 40S ribosomal protein S21-2-like [Camelina sativa]|uniref:40S ribosomal protein S21-2-like n=1 Tax=Camelina sativa TaxID=90675 RepID=A0ABM0ZEV2_CAMSA|nr:PREDICTED: 40S ribosomal protein S21-2-like [Camelina sativa]
MVERGKRNHNRLETLTMRTTYTCSATIRLITSKDHASVQLNIGHLDADGVYTGQFTTFALCGFVRAQGDADSGVDRLW